MADILGDRRTDRRGHNGRRSGSRRLTEGRGQVLAESAVVRVDARALGPAVRLNVCCGVGSVTCSLELRIGHGGRSRSTELDQRRHQGEDAKRESADPHEWGV